MSKINIIVNMEEKKKKNREKNWGMEMGLRNITTWIWQARFSGAATQERI